MSNPPGISNDNDIVARAGTYYRNARYLICALALGAGLWFGYDGWINWPREQANFKAMTPQQQGESRKPHTELDIQIQLILAGGLIPLAPILLAFFLYRSRGAYRLSGNTLFVPGHPPVPFDAIVGIDKSNWDRKGIAYVDYQLSQSSTPRRLTLDDFIYDRDPTDEIVHRIEAFLEPADAASDGDNSDEPGADSPVDHEA